MSDDLPQGQTVPQNQDDGAVVATAETQPVSTPRKEQGPPLVQAEPISTPPAVEVIQPQAEQAAVPEQTVEHRETTSSETPQKEVTEANHSPVTAPPLSPVVSVPNGPTLPLTYQEALEIEKGTAIVDSKRWFAKLMEFLWKRKDPGIAAKKPN